MGTQAGPRLYPSRSRLPAPITTSGGRMSRRKRARSDLQAAMRNLRLFEQLFEAGLLTVKDSILAYHGIEPRTGMFRFYPPALFTFWSAFESFVSHSSFMLVHATKGIPAEVRSFLLEVERVVKPNGKIEERHRPTRVLDRYWQLLHWGYGLKADRGEKVWQRVEAVRRKRNALAHPDPLENVSLTTSEILDTAESILLLLITHSAHLGRTINVNQYQLHDIVAELRPLADEFEERPMFADWEFKEEFGVHLNYNNVDDERFPTLNQLRQLRQSRK